MCSFLRFKLVHSLSLFLWGLFLIWKLLVCWTSAYSLFVHLWQLSPESNVWFYFCNMTNPCRCHYLAGAHELKIQDRPKKRLRRRWRGMMVMMVVTTGICLEKTFPIVPRLGSEIAKIILDAVKKYSRREICSSGIAPIQGYWVLCAGWILYHLWMDDVDKFSGKSIDEEPFFFNTA